MLKPQTFSIISNTNTNKNTPDKPQRMCTLRIKLILSLITHNLNQSTDSS